ncbi:carboxypeptidase-like regulatory domain-containing protein [Aquimarina sp. MMG015]|uniref:carboxypeptidase-like regulatory domain-containing protein n=1 Tax=Aquimarina TaxID=290174 RepID=UPI00042991D4|nr:MULTISPECIES: carboxypeptidase-like regulatory domain-containing protein [Aquimarina]AXT55807.1 carboxypeptidase-like regulatory domain-containing protein [Aquimarina sp. AD1]MBQ4805369.1 carboxypeptidase-like regulatory domain-containing protein [Aquimarina sp. MMG015]RKN16381.1 carboxypeptidase-like regulatory domain-containing protein [Aquimarina sp. AD1]
MKRFLIYILLIVGISINAQETDSQTVSGKVLNASTDSKLQSVHVVNLSQVIGTITNKEGDFEIKAKVNDTLYFTYIGYKPLRVRVTNDWKKFGDVKIKMTELGIALEEVVVADVQLTGYLEIDAKKIPVYNNYRYSISGLNSGYEGGSRQPGAVNKVLGAIFNPADFLYNIFSKRSNELRKLRKMKKDDEIRNLLETKFDRATLMALLQVERIDIDEILRNCNYSADFIKFANDLQILDAISECYEEYKVLDRK